jgi:ADP-ribosyl-[dinitrogen reductase] hydrolase
MIGGGAFGWQPGEFTDDTQMALALAESLIERNLQFDTETTWDHFRAWANGASDIGITTRSTLSKSDWRTASEQAHRELGRSASNGSVMRIAPIGIAAVLWDSDTTIRIAREQFPLKNRKPAGDPLTRGSLPERKRTPHHESAEAPARTV